VTLAGCPPLAAGNLFPGNSGAKKLSDWCAHSPATGNR